MIKKISFILAALWLTTAVPTMAANDPVLKINGVTVEKTVTKITFEGDNVVLHFADTSMQQADMESVVLTFGSTTAIQNLSAFTLRGLVDGQLQLSGLKKGTEVLIYNAAGKQVLRSTSAKINVSQLKSGVYLLKADHQIVKFVKR